MEKLIEAYKTVNPNAELELQTTVSTTGVSGALEGTYTIGMASRELKAVSYTHLASLRLARSARCWSAASWRLSSPFWPSAS